MKILLIEDDRELAESMKFQLEKEGYETDICDDGEEGLYYMKERSHDLVILDRMLPSMDGITVLQEARKNHVSTPVIMLTALGELQDKLTGLKGGADDYMVKPCNFKLLIARALQFVAMELKAKQKAEEKAQLEKALGQETTLKENAPLEKAEQSSCGEVILVKPVKELKKNEPTLLMSTLDKKFKDKLEAIVAQHIGDNNFNVDRLAELLSLGRTTVYNRTKSIMGVSPNIYIQNERLRIAAKLLLEGEYTVSEISEKVGFSDSTYFYKCFKNKFGIAPSKYGK